MPTGHVQPIIDCDEYQVLLHDSVGPYVYNIAATVLESAAVNIEQDWQQLTRCLLWFLYRYKQCTKKVSLRTYCSVVLVTHPRHVYV